MPATLELNELGKNWAIGGTSIRTGRTRGLLIAFVFQGRLTLVPSFASAFTPSALTKSSGSERTHLNKPLSDPAKGHNSLKF